MPSLAHSKISENIILTLYLSISDRIRQGLNVLQHLLLTIGGCLLTYQNITKQANKGDVTLFLKNLNIGTARLGNVCKRGNVLDFEKNEK